METKRSAKKLRASIVAGTLAVAMALTGTFAWRSISQRQRNELRNRENPGARLHDDFDGINKDIYAENFTNLSDGVPVFVRVKLLEYMEYGADAGVNRDAASRRINVVTPDSMTDAEKAAVDINNSDTWAVHKPGDTGSKPAADDPFHDDWLLDFGGSTVFMPTFNKNKDSLSVDVNGTYGKYNAATGQYDTGFTPYSDYKTYTLDPTAADNVKVFHEITADAYYDADDEDPPHDEYLDNPNVYKPGAGGVMGVNYTVGKETHKAKATRNATVLTMAQWKGMGSPVGDFWVWDTDGWAYWAAPIMPEEATGTLLTGVRKTSATRDNCYYAIDVVGQFATANDWGEKDDGTGFFEGGEFSEDAQKLLEQASKVSAGNNGKRYIDKGNNVYQEIDSDTGRTGVLVCAGKDLTIGTSDDIANVFDAKDDVKIPADTGTSYGRYFLTPDSTHAYYRGMGPDEKLGTDDDTRVWADSTQAFPGGTLETAGADTVEVTAEGGAHQIVAGGKLQFHAAVKKGGSTAVDQTVTWSLTGNTSVNTTIDPVSGLLSVDKDEGIGSTLLVTAAAKADDRVTNAGGYSVQVTAPDAITVSVTAADSEVKAGSPDGLQLTVKVTEGVTAIKDPTITWEHTETPAVTPVSGKDMSITIDSNNVLKVGKDVPENTKITVTANAAFGDSKTGSGKLENINVVHKTLVTINGPDTVEAGSTGSYSITHDMDGAGNSATWRVVSPASGASFDRNTLKVDKTVKAGTTITIEATATDAGSVTKTKDVTVAHPTGVTISGSNAVARGGSITLTAKVENGTEAGYTTQDVKWEKISGGGDISTDGVLTVSATETATSVTVRATSAVAVKANGAADKTISIIDGVDLKGATHENEQTVDIDGIGWYVLYKESNRALIIPDTTLEERPFGKDNNDRFWKDSAMRAYLNGEWLSGKETLSQVALETTIYTREDYDSTEMVPTNDKVFLLSRADIDGLENGTATSDPRCYTLGVVKPLLRGYYKWYRPDYYGTHGVSWYWLRSPFYDKNWEPHARLDYVYSTGPFPDAGQPISIYGGVRPVLWIAIKPGT